MQEDSAAHAAAFELVLEVDAVVMSSQSDEVDGLAIHNFVAGVDLLVPGFRRVVVEDRHPATGIVHK